MTDQEYFEECRNLFMTKGWELYMEEVKLGMDAITIAGLSTSEEFWKAKGKLAKKKLKESKLR